MLHRRPFRFLALGALATLAVAACDTIQMEEPPKGAISVGDDLYAVPIEKTGNCTSYRLWSGTKMVAAAVHYFDRDGKLTLDKTQCAK